MNNPLVSIIISTKNEAKRVERLLVSITHQKYKRIEIIVVDNHSTDETVKIIEKYTKKIYHKGPERATQRNYGAQKAQGTFLFFLDADMELSSEIIQEAVDVFFKKNTVAGLIIPEIVPEVNLFARVKNLEKKIYYQEEAIEACRFIKKTAFLETGGYNEKLIAGEDWDLHQKLSSYGQIGRIKTPLLHWEISLIRELQHKIYYTSHMLAYEQVNRKYFSKQSGLNRVNIFWRKRSILIRQPILAVLLITVKGTEYIFYLFMKIKKYGKKK